MLYNAATWGFIKEASKAYEAVMALVKPMQNDVRFATTKDMGRTGITPALFDCILARIADGGMLIHQGALAGSCACRHKPAIVTACPFLQLSPKSACPGGLFAWPFQAGHWPNDASADVQTAEAAAALI
jgi:hypothetical protein